MGVGDIECQQFEVCTVRQRNECVLGQPAGVRSTGRDLKSDSLEIGRSLVQIFDEDNGMINGKCHQINNSHGKHGKHGVAILTPDLRFLPRESQHESKHQK